MGETTYLNWWSPDFSHWQYCGGRLVPGHSASLHHLVDGGNRLGLGCDESYSSVLAGWCSLLAHELRFRELGGGGSCFDIQSLSKQEVVASIQREKGELSRFSCAFLDMRFLIVWQAGGEAAGCVHRPWIRDATTCQNSWISSGFELPLDFRPLWLGHCRMVPQWDFLVKVNPRTGKNCTFAQALHVKLALPDLLPSWMCLKAKAVFSRP